jgi:hypothetical protein
MLVQYHDRFDVVAEFHPSSGRLEVQPRPPGLSPSQTHGWFSILAGVTVVFYRRANHLWLRVGERVFDLDGGASVDWRTEDGVAVFRAEDASGEVVVRYRAGPNLDQDPTPFVEDEDFDLGLYVANVLLDEERSHLVRSGAH